MDHSQDTYNPILSGLPAPQQAALKQPLLYSEAAREEAGGILRIREHWFL